MSTRLMAIIVFILSACGPAAADMERHKQHVLDRTPIKNALASSKTVYFCEEAIEEDYEILCEACEVSLHDIDDGGEISSYKVWATHFYYELRPRNEGEQPVISSAGERKYEKWETSELNAAAAREIFDAANTWCQARREGEFHVLKDEIDAWFAENTE